MTDVRIRDISPRLTFQAAPASTSQKVELVNRLIAAGVPAIEVSSFVRPDLVPGLADAAEVFARVDRRAGVSLECCVGSISGVKRAIDSGAHKAWFLLAVDEDFSTNNSGRTVEDSLKVLEQIRAETDGKIEVGTYLIHAFGGPVGLGRDPRELGPLMSRLKELQIGEWILADSSGYAAPPQTRATVDFAARIMPTDSLHLQVHDSRGMGLANIAEVVRTGFRNIDTALAGAGGHPARPSARVGGVCTEDAVQMLHLMGIDTGIDLPQLIDSANWLAQILDGGALGFTRKVGAVPLTAGDIDTGRMNFKWPGKPVQTSVAG